MTIEEAKITAALCSVNTAAKLRARLVEARNMLRKDLKKLFSVINFEPEKMRLVSGCGRYVLEWKIRERPDEPVGPRNQQTSMGCVLFSPKKGD